MLKFFFEYIDMWPRSDIYMKVKSDDGNLLKKIG